MLWQPVRSCTYTWSMMEETGLTFSWMVVPIRSGFSRVPVARVVESRRFSPRASATSRAEKVTWPPPAQGLGPLLCQVPGLPVHGGALTPANFSSWAIRARYPSISGLMAAAWLVRSMPRSTLPSEKAASACWIRSPRRFMASRYFCLVVSLMSGAPFRIAFFFKCKACHGSLELALLVVRGRLLRRGLGYLWASRRGLSGLHQAVVLRPRAPPGRAWAGPPWTGSHGSRPRRSSGWCWGR